MIETDDFEEVTRIKMSVEQDGKAVYWAAAYLVDGLLIDTGPHHTREELLAFLEGRCLRLAVNTHFHEDHIGANRLIQERFGIDVFAHPDSIPLIALKPELKWYQEWVWGYPEPSRVSPIGVAVETPRFRFEVIPTEGHCPGHVALAELERGWCFSGDIFISEHPKVIRADEEVAALIRSMRLLSELDTERLVLFTSMGRIIPDGRLALQRCIDYLEELGGRAKELAAAGLALKDIGADLFGRVSSLGALTAGHFSSENLVASLLKM
jgi:glyoxylase-like metal-dependent hydrolase (beta-lactamase superfamily II)